MSGYSISNVGSNDYVAMLSNPYLMYYNPYMSYQGLGNSSKVAFQGVTKPSASQSGAAASVATSGAVTEKKSRNTAKFVIGTALTLGAAALCRKAYVKGGGQGWFSKDCLSKVKNGFVEMFKDTKAKFPQLTERFTLDPNTNTCQIPGKINKLQGANVADDIRKLGGKVDIPNLADDGVEILEATFPINSRSSVTFKDGKISTFINSKGKKVAVSEMTEAERDKVAKILNKIKNKDTATLDKLTRVSYTQTQNEVTSYFAKGFDVAEDGITDGLQYGLTKKFHLDSDDAKVYLKEHEQVKKALDEYLAGTAKELKYAYAEYPVSGVGTLRIENGKVTGIEIIEGGVKKFYDKESVKFKAQDLEDTVEKIFEHTDDFVNPRYKF